MEKKGKVGKKRGRPKKPLTVEKEKELTSNIVDYNSNETEATEMEKRRKVTKRVSEDKQELTSNSVNDNVNDSSSSPGTASASLDSRPRTLLSLASAKKAAPNTPSIIPLRNIDGYPSEASTLMVVKQTLYGSNRVDKANHVPVEAPPSEPPVRAKDAHSLNESTCGDKITEAHDDMSSSSKLLSPRFGSVYKRHKRTSQTSHNPTTSPSCSLSPASPMGNNSFESVEGYKVNKEVAPLLKAIFSKYGDIAKESTFSSMESRVWLLECICSIYKRLEASKFKLLMPSEIQSMLGQIRDIELVKVDLGWLHRRLDQISKAQQMYKGVSTFEDVKARSLQDITEKQKAVQICKEAYEACMANASKLQEEIQQAKDELSTAQSFADEINIYD